MEERRSEKRGELSARLGRILYGDARGYSEIRRSSRSKNSGARETRPWWSAGRILAASPTSASPSTSSTKTCVSSSTLSRTSRSLARETVAARCVTSSIAPRTIDAPATAIILEIAVDGATSPARHCTRIARIAAGCRPSVRRLMASASRPVRLVIPGDQSKTLGVVASLIL